MEQIVGMIFFVMGTRLLSDAVSSTEYLFFYFAAATIFLFLKMFSVFIDLHLQNYPIW